MPPGFISASALAATVGDTLAVDLPPTRAAGDVVLLVVSGSDLTNPPTFPAAPPTGWTEVARQDHASADHALIVYQRVLTGGDATPVDVTVPTIWLGAAGYTVGYRAVDNATPLDVTPVTATSGGVQTWKPPDITTATNNAKAVSVAATPHINAIALLAGSEQGFTVRVSGADYDSGAGEDHSHGLADKTQATAGAVTAPTWNQTVAGPNAWLGITMALRFDPGPVIAPAAASAQGAVAAPSVVFGSITTAPAPASAVGAVVAPNVNLGQTVQPAPASAIAAVVAPAVVQGSLSVSPAPASAVAVAVDPNVGSNAVFINVGFVSAVAAIVAPSVRQGSLLVAPPLASAQAARAVPVTLIGFAATGTVEMAESLTVNIGPSPASAVGAVVAPTPILGSMTAAPPPATAQAAVVAPVINIVEPASASASAAVVAPSVVMSSTTAEPTAASATAAVGAPDVIAPHVITPTEASAVGAVGGPDIVLGNIVFVPEPAAAFTSALGPAVIMPPLFANYPMLIQTAPTDFSDIDKNFMGYKILSYLHLEYDATGSPFELPVEVVVDGESKGIITFRIEEGATGLLPFDLPITLSEPVIRRQTEPIVGDGYYVAFRITENGANNPRLSRLWVEFDMAGVSR